MHEFIKIPFCFDVGLVDLRDFGEGDYNNNNKEKGVEESGFMT